jgi:hypothetical protein
MVAFYAIIGIFVTWMLYSLMFHDVERDQYDGHYDKTSPSRPTLHLGSPYPGGEAPATWPTRANAVRDAFKHAYRGYERYAAPADELLPLSEQPTDKWAIAVSIDYHS